MAGSSEEDEPRIEAVMRHPTEAPRSAPSPPTSAGIVNLTYPNSIDNNVSVRAPSEHNNKKTSRRRGRYTEIGTNDNDNNLHERDEIVLTSAINKSKPLSPSQHRDRNKGQSIGINTNAEESATTNRANTDRTDESLGCSSGNRPGSTLSSSSSPNRKEHFYRNQPDEVSPSSSVMSQFDDTPPPERDGKDGQSFGAWNLCATVVHCFFPLTRLFAALCRCDRRVFWRILPSVLVTKAFWLSVAALGLCDLARIVAVVDSVPSTSSTVAPPFLDHNGDGSIELTFGLWAYSMGPQYNHDHFPDQANTSINGTTPLNNSSSETSHAGHGNLLENEVNKVRTCIFSPSHRLGASVHDADDSPFLVFFIDPLFRTARAFGIIAVGAGGIAMLTIWVIAASSTTTTTITFYLRSLRWKRWYIGAGVFLCCAFEGLTLLILRAGVCDDSTRDGEGILYRDCTIAEGSSTIITSCAFWFFTGLSVWKLPMPGVDYVPSPQDHEEEVDVNGEESSQQLEDNEDQNNERPSSPKAKKQFWQQFGQHLQPEFMPTTTSSSRPRFHSRIPSKDEDDDSGTTWNETELTVV